jgi:hypothetical protein
MTACVCDMSQGESYQNIANGDDRLSTRALRPRAFSDPLPQVVQSSSEIGV